MKFHSFFFRFIIIQLTQRNNKIKYCNKIIYKYANIACSHTVKNLADYNLSYDFVYAINQSINQSIKNF